MPKKPNEGSQNDVQDPQENIFAEEQDMEDEIDENVGVPPRKVTEEDVIGAEKAFEDLIESEEIELERTPFRPGKDTKFVMTDRQRYYLEDGIAQINKYLNKEKGLARTNEANQKLVKLRDAMNELVEVGLDGLSENDRKTIEGFNDVMNTQYFGDTTLSQNIYDRKNPYDLEIGELLGGIDMLSVMTGIPATYKHRRPQKYINERTNIRTAKVEDTMRTHPEEGQEIKKTADLAGLEKLIEKFKDTEIGEKLGQINTIVKDLGDWKNGSYYIYDHLKAADGFGTFLTQKGPNGKTNYDTIAEAILGKKQTSEKKQAFDLLLGQLNSVCTLDIGVPYAIEAKEAYDWDKGQVEWVNAQRIDELNKKLFGKDAEPSYADRDFLDSLSTMNRMLLKMIQADVYNKRPEDTTKLSGAHRGFDKIVETMRSIYAGKKLDNTNEGIIHALNFGKTLHQEIGYNGETVYELLARTYEQNGGTREELDSTLEKMNEKFGMKIVIPGKEVDGKKAQPVIVEQHEPYVRKIKEVQRASSRQYNVEDLKNSLAMVLALRRMSVDPAHKDHKKIRSKAAMGKAVAIKETAAFKELTKNMTIDELAKKIGCPGNFDKAYTAKVKELDIAKYKNMLQSEDYQKKMANSALKAANKMEETGTGVYMFGIKRGSNSGMYDRAVIAMKRAHENKDAATTFQSVQTVKEYLSNKMTKRHSPSGQNRWEDCMEFLHETMPKEEFEEYCREVNNVRDVKEGDKDFVKPEQFAPKAKQNAGPEVQQEALQTGSQGPAIGGPQ